MRLTRKFVLVLVLGIVAVLAVYAYMRVERELALFDKDMRRDAALMGAVLAHATAYAFRTEGEVAALSLVRDVAKKSQHVQVRFVWLEPSTDERYLPELAFRELDTVLAGRTLSHRSERAGGALYTYVPVQVPDSRKGAVELRESLEDERAYVETTIRSTVVSTLLLVVLYALLAGAVGAVFVGRPTRQLVQKVRRIGGGDLTVPVQLAQRDELGEIAAEINAMCERLAAADERLRKEIEDRIATVQQLRHADRLMTVGKLASGIAHELGTPLNVVAGRAQMIIAGESQGGQVQDDARIIVEQAKRMTNIIRQLLEFARPRASQPTSVDLRTIAQQAVALLEPMAVKRGVRLSLTAGEAVVAMVDPTQIQQALANLVVNAIHAVGDQGHVRMSVTRASVKAPADRGGGEATWAILSVTDDGHGMDAETQARIFEPFFTTKDIGEGTGLGLAVTHGIVSEHGGWIETTSAPGAGSTFSIYLPLAQEGAGT